MPYIKVSTNHEFKDKHKEQLLTKLSKFAAIELGKPEDYVMCVIAESPHIIFSGTFDPAVFIEFKSIGLKDTQTEKLSKSLCEIITQETGILPERIYIEFISVNGKMWGWNSSTF